MGGTKSSAMRRVMYTASAMFKICIRSDIAHLGPDVAFRWKNYHLTPVEIYSKVQRNHFCENSSTLSQIRFIQRKNSFIWRFKLFRSIIGPAILLGCRTPSGAFSVWVLPRANVFYSDVGYEDVKRDKQVMKQALGTESTLQRKSRRRKYGAT